MLAPLQKRLASFRWYHNLMRHPLSFSSPQGAPSGTGSSNGRADASFLLLDRDEACIVAEPSTYARIVQLANDGKLELRFGEHGGREVAIVGDRNRPLLLLRVQALSAYQAASQPPIPLFAGMHTGGAFVKRELGLLELATQPVSPSSAKQPSLELGDPLEEAWVTSRSRYQVVGAPF